jgi:hypothetical protein
LRLYEIEDNIEDNQNASIYILKSKTNGFFDILIKNAGSFSGKQDVLLKYENDRYEPNKVGNAK